MSRGRNNLLAAQNGEYLVCAELGRRGLIATPFAGNVPEFDVLATSEECRSVPIQVKATRGTTWPTDARRWMVLSLDEGTGRQGYVGPQEIDNPDLIYVHVAIGAGTGQDGFFILPQRQLQQVCIGCCTSWMEKHAWIRPRKTDSFDLRYDAQSLAAYENNWQIIMKQLRPLLPARTPGASSLEDIPLPAHLTMALNSTGYLHDMPSCALPCIFLFAYEEFERRLLAALQKIDPEARRWDPLWPTGDNWRAFVAQRGQAAGFVAQTFEQGTRAREAITRGNLTVLTRERWERLIAGWQHVIAYTA